MTPRSDFFKHLMQSSGDLVLALQENPAIISERDEKGMTLLHHAASIPNWGYKHIGEILQTLLESPGINFAIIDNDGNTPLHVAAIHCYQKHTCHQVFPRLVHEAAQQNFDFSTLDENGKSILHIATEVSYVDIQWGPDHSADTQIRTRTNNVLNVLNNATHPGLNTLSTYGYTAFAYAVEKGNFAEAHALLDAGANPSLYGAPDGNPMVIIEKRIQSYVEILNNTPSTWRKVIENCNRQLEKLSFLKERMLSDNPLSLHEAASVGHMPSVQYLLEEKDADINEKSSYGAKTALMFAAENGHLPVVAYLLKRSAEMSSEVLNLAVKNNHFNVVSYLCVNQAVSNHYIDFIYYAFHEAVLNKNVEMANLLLTYGAQINQTNARNTYDWDHKTPLMLAAEMGYPDMIDLLIYKGADLNATDSHGNNAFMYAAQNDNLETVRLLLLYDSPVDKKNKWGFTALMLAAREGQTEVVKFLLANNANINEQSTRGATALMLACKANHLSTVCLLLENGADADIVSKDKLNALTCVALAKTNSVEDKSKQLQILNLLLSHGIQTGFNLAFLMENNIPANQAIMQELCIFGIEIQSLTDESKREHNDPIDYLPTLTLLAQHKEEKNNYEKTKREVYSFFSSNLVPSNADNSLKNFFKGQSFFKLIDDYIRPSHDSEDTDLVKAAIKTNQEIVIKLL